MNKPSEKTTMTLSTIKRVWRDMDDFNRATLETDIDANGNKIVRVKVERPAGRRQRHSFTVQTNGNLPEIHRDGITYFSLHHILDYVVAHGTPRQLEILELAIEIATS